VAPQNLRSSNLRETQAATGLGLADQAGRPVMTTERNQTSAHHVKHTGGLLPTWRHQEMLEL
jgi:hypothetical protein